MIGQLSGTLIEKQAPQVIINVHGVGYEVYAPMSTFYKLPEQNQEVTLFTHLIVREDAHHLYGFFTRSERTLFRTLLKVNGVGPRLALTILSSIEVNEFVQCVTQQETARLICLPGIGKKTAERLVMEMRDKLKEWSSELPPVLNSDPKSNRNQTLQDAISALVSLGYKPQEASRAVSRIDAVDMSSEEIIRRALQEVSA